MAGPLSDATMHHGVEGPGHPDYQQSDRPPSAFRFLNRLRTKSRVPREKSIMLDAGPDGRSCLSSNRLVLSRAGAVPTITVLG